jgi:hypothetical protein
VDIIYILPVLTNIVLIQVLSIYENSEFNRNWFNNFKEQKKYQQLSLCLNLMLFVKMTQTPGVRLLYFFGTELTIIGNLNCRKTLKVLE